MVNFAQNTNFDVFPQKLNTKAHFPNFSDFLHVWCVFYNIWKLVILKVILCLGYSLKKRWKLAQKQILIFSLKNNIWMHIFSIFQNFTHLGRFLKHTLYVHWNHYFFWIRTNLLKLEKYAFIYCFWGKISKFVFGLFFTAFKWLFITTTFENSNRKINIIL